MKRMLFVVCMLLIAGGSLTLGQATTAPAASQPAARVTNAEHHFSFALPGAMHSMPASEMETINKASPVKFIAGLRSNTGDVPYSLFQSMPRPAAFLGGQVEDFRKGLESARIEVLDVQYDAKKLAYIARIRADSPLGKLQALSVTFIGKDEIISVHNYALDGEFAKTRATFDKLVDSFQFDKEAALPATRKD